MAIYRPPSSAITNFKNVGKGGATGGFTGAAESLLAQQAEDRKRAKKKMKSQERRALALGLLGLGSTIYNCYFSSPGCLLSRSDSPLNSSVFVDN